MIEDKCFSCGQERKPSPSELWTRARNAEIPEIVARALARESLPPMLEGHVGRTSGGTAESFDPKKANVSYTVVTTREWVHRGGVLTCFYDPDLDRAIAAACLFLKAWQGRFTPEVPC